MTTASRVAIGRNYCHWKTKNNRDTNIKNVLKPGFVSPWFVVVAFLFLAGIYLYFINSSATKGYQIRQIEGELTNLKKESEQLRIREAELKSLYHIEESSKQLNMAETVQMSFIEEKSPVAMR